MRVSKRYVIGSAGLLVAGCFGGLAALLHMVYRDLESTRGQVEELRRLALDQRDEIGALKDRLVAVGDQLVTVRELEERARAKLRERLEVELAQRAQGERAGVDQQLQRLEGQVQGLVTAAKENARLLAAARQGADTETVYRELMSPTVRVQSKTEVGSGTILWSRALGGGKALTYVLTAWHIVSDAGADKTELPLEVDFYARGELLRTELARVVAHHEQLDLAVLEVKGYHVYATKARIPDLEDLPGIPMFSRVYAIGCPLGYAPLPSSGELTSKEKELDGNHYWMVNAPTIFGNSGGGIYLADSRTMIGVLSRISAYKNMIDVAVPHMGLVTPMDQVYGWLDSTRFGFVYRDRLSELKAPREVTSSGALPASQAKDDAPGGEDRKTR
ncbi:MAG: trypsin-like peptidase domain-containing protein [Planctomycetota bacterium]